MKSICVCALILSIAVAGEFIPRNQLNNLAGNLVREKFGPGFSLEEILTYYGDDDLPNALSFIYRNKERVVNIVLGARYNCSPVFEISQNLPNYYTKLDKAKSKTEERLNTTLEFDRIYYFGPHDEYFCFRNNEEKILVNTYSLMSYNKKEFFENFKKVENPESEKFLKNKWDKYLNQTGFFRDTVMNYVDSVPFIDWVYGCSPTAASMILWYWDPRGYGRLVDYFFTHWDNPEGEWNECANVNRELAIRMNTDTLTGGTTINNIGPGIMLTCNTNNGYSFSCQTSSQGGSWNQFQFSWIKTEIDNQRPCHWNVLHYQGDPNFNHSVTAVGYAYGSSLPDTFIIVHDTWTIDEPWWPLWTYANGYQSYDYVVTVIPGGANSNNVLLDFPIGGDVYSIPTLFANLKYKIRWTSMGSEIDHIKMWWSKGVNGESYDSLYWHLIGGYLPNTGEYIWTVPISALSCSIRVNIAGLDVFDYRYGADGSFGRSIVRSPNHSPEINLVGHCDTDGSANDVALTGDYAFIADGTKGLVVVDISDSSLPEVCGRLPLPGNSISLAISGEYLYLGDREDTLRIISISDPLNPVQVSKLPIGDDVNDVFFSNNKIYIAARAVGLVIVDVTNPSVPIILGTYNTSGFAQDVYVYGSYAYVADATKGVRVIDVSNPQNPQETGFYDTPGITYGVCRVGSYVYAADGTAGIKIFDGSNPDTLILLGSLDTPGTATKLIWLNNYLFVADGSQGGIRAINVQDPANPAEAGYIQSFGSAGNLYINGSMVYLADGGIGLLLITQSLTGIYEQINLPKGIFVEVMPNPCSRMDQVKIVLSAPTRTGLSILLFDCAGRMLGEIYKGFIGEGENRIYWQPEGIPGGVYFIKIELGNERVIRKVVFTR
ncbi:MAG: hypothetical protein ABIL70_05975 [candidate division WOR-3 bacterium]